MFTTLEKDLKKICFLAALMTSLVNVLTAFGLFFLCNYNQGIAIPWLGVLAAAFLLIFPLAGVTYFYAAMKAALLTGRADTGVAVGCLAGLISGLITTVVLMGVYVVFYVIPVLLGNGLGFAVLFCAIIGFWLLVICGIVFIFFQGLCCGLLGGEIGGKLGEEWWADEATSEVGASSSTEQSNELRAYSKTVRDV